VKSDSPAQKAGLRVGDRILRFGGQQIISVADVEWILSTADKEPSLEAGLGHKAKRVRASMTLPVPGSDNDVQLGPVKEFGGNQKSRAGASTCSSRNRISFSDDASGSCSSGHLPVPCRTSQATQEAVNPDT
jgi:hypothetical protein